MSDGLLVDLVKSGGISGALVAMGLLYLALQIKALQKSIDEFKDHVFPRLDDYGDRLNEHGERISKVEARIVPTLSKGD